MKKGKESWKLRKWMNEIQKKNIFDKENNQKKIKVRKLKII